MEFPSIFGLPAHPLIVHATVVLVPLAALLVLAHAFVPAARARLGIVTPVVALVAVVLVPLSTSSGEQLESQVGHNPLIEQHSELADGLLPWVIGLLVVAVLLWLRDRYQDRDVRGGAVLRSSALVAVLAVVAVAGTTQQVVRIGHSGAKAAWKDVSTSSSASGSSDDH